MREIKVVVTFLKPEQGGRESTPQNLLSSKQYRPHFVPSNSKEIKPSDYMGVCFISQNGNLAPGFECKAKVALVYEGVDYACLIPNFKFNIVEGRQIVGYGHVL